MTPKCIVCQGIHYRQGLCTGCWWLRRRHGVLPGDPRAIEQMIESRKKRWEIIASKRKVDVA